MLTIEERLDRIEGLLRLSAKEVLNADEAALLLGISSGRVRHLTSAKEIPFYRQGRKVWYKKSELEKWQLRNRVETKDEIDAQATTIAFLATRNRRKN